ncbi:MAG: PTS glucose transporter subunit IIA [Collinsella sp.]
MSGRVDVVTVTNHAIGILSETGAKVLIHVGLDTIDMDGKGFPSAMSRRAISSPLVSPSSPFDDEAIKASRP